ncbi:MAG: DNA gyrase inhibitor YacG [Pseudoruegeria sp.]
MTCPICTNASKEKYRPFCSKRCADVDLGKWLNESYTLPATREDDLEEAAEAIIEISSKPH